jgi:hypothetical protein
MSDCAPAKRLDAELIEAPDDPTAFENLKFTARKQVERSLD